MASHKFEELVRQITARSVSDIWEAARDEWELDHIYVTEPDDPGTCLCTHYPILEHCVLANKLNGQSAIVGNVCVKNFMGLPSDLLFRGIARISEDRSRAANYELVRHAYRKNWLNDWEYHFCFGTRHKRKLSWKQEAKRIQINSKILRNMKWCNQGEPEG